MLIKRLIIQFFSTSVFLYTLVGVIFFAAIDFPKAVQARSHYLLGIFYNDGYKNYYDGILYFDHLTRVEPERAGSP